MILNLDTPIRIAITDDHPLVREGLRTMLSMYPDIYIMGDYGKASHLMEGLRNEQPDILLLDLQLPDTTGEELTPKLRKLYPDMRIIILTGNNSTYSIKLMLNYGVHGYILKNMEQEMLLKAIEKVYYGDIFLSPELQERLLKLTRKMKNAHISIGDLTPREIEILKLITEEFTTQEIADKLHLSFKTIENYRIILMQKLDAKNVVGMTKKAIYLGIIE